MRNLVEETGFGTHILARTRHVDVDQVSSVDGSRTNGFIYGGFTVDTLDGWVKPQHLGNIALQDVSLVGVRHEGLGDIGLIEEDVGHVGEC